MNKHQKRMIETITEHLSRPIPHWVTHIGQDEDGTIVGFNYQPNKTSNRVAGGFWEDSIEEDQYASTIFIHNQSDNPNWEQTLVTVIVKTTYDYGDIQ